MPPTDRYELVALDASRREDVLRLDTWAFPTSIALDDLLKIPTSAPFERLYGATDARTAELAAVYGTHTFASYPVPGAQIPCGWLTWVGVHPGHRRRGILRSMIAHHFADCAARGEAISGLMAAEPAIYGRFGYGLAATHLNLTIPRGAALRPVPGSEVLEVSLEEWDSTRHGELAASVHRAYASLPPGLGRPGWATWETPALRTARDDDPPAFRHGGEARRIAIVRDHDDAVRAYATFRRSSEWGRGGPSGTVHVREAVALDAAAAHRLWTVLLDLDLMTDTKIGYLPTDDPLTSLLVDLRKTVPGYEDNSWIRIVDLPAALAQRRYAGALDVVVAVRDDLVPANAGTWHVTAEPWGHARACRTDAAPALGLDVRELGAAYLGSTSLAALAQAGFVDVHDADALGRAAAAFSWPVAAGANWVF